LKTGIKIALIKLYLIELIIDGGIMFKRLVFILLTSLLFTNLLIGNSLHFPSDIVTAVITDSQIEVTFKIPDGLYQDIDEEYFFVNVEEIPGITFQPTIYPETELINNVKKYKKSVTLLKNFVINHTVFKPESVITIYAGYQFCTVEGTCLFPEEVQLTLSIDGSSSGTVSKIGQNKNDTGTMTEYENMLALLSDFTVTAVESGYYNSQSFLSFLQTSKDAEYSATNTFANKSLWLIILLILIGGIALNLTPCVLPMLPITIAVLGAGTQAESKGKGFFIGSIYGLGMALAYGVLGVIVVLSGSQFGQLNASPIFNIVIAVLFLLLALATFDIITIDFSRWQSGNVRKKSKSKFITVFFLGVLAAILAGACVAPILISVIIYSTTLFAHGNSAGLLLPFLLGVGMAIPWPFAGAGLSFLPKPGNWMKWVKIIFGIIILALAFQYGFTAYKTIRTTAKIDIKSVEKSDLNWVYSISEGLELAKAENKPVFIDFWATWCKNCLAMDASTFKDEAVKKEFENFIIVKYQAEKLKESPTKEILKHFEVLGLPTYIVLKPNVQEVTK
jgi:thiol:disulfide interchange protein